MGSGFRTFASGEVLTADNVQNYLMDQAVMVFAGTAARASALPSPEVGMTAYSTATGMQVWDGSAWVAVGAQVLDVEFLLVGGGGGGGGTGGGGGGGGFVTGSGIIGKDTYTVKVGAGGAYAATAGRQNGTASSFIGSANGGGGGSGNDSTIGANGASGGGGRNGGVGGSSISGEGNAGGTAQSGFNGAGGGGASAAGQNSPNGTTGGNGGAGSSNNYTGTSIGYSGGGGGYGTSTGGTATDGGGASSTNGTANRGGGGGGNGGSGGSGRVVVRWLTADGANFTITSTGSPTTGTDGSYTYYAWDSTGSLTLA